MEEVKLEENVTSLPIIQFSKKPNLTIPFLETIPESVYSSKIATSHDSSSPQTKLMIHSKSAPNLTSPHWETSARIASPKLNLPLSSPSRSSVRSPSGDYRNTAASPKSPASGNKWTETNLGVLPTSAAQSIQRSASAIQLKPLNLARSFWGLVKYASAYSPGGSGFLASPVASSAPPLTDRFNSFQSPFPAYLRECANCHSSIPSTPIVCARCLGVGYCTPKCQLIHRHEHRSTCVRGTCQANYGSCENTAAVAFCGAFKKFSRQHLCGMRLCELHCYLHDRSAGGKRHPCSKIVDGKDVLARFQRPANDQTALSLHNLGVCYQYGIGCSNNLGRARELFAMAADESQHASSQFALGEMYRDGEGTPQDFERAIEYYTLAAAQGHPLASCYLARFYQLGDGVKRNEARAVELFQVAAARGNAKAQTALAHCFRDGTGVPPDRVRAIELYTLAAEQGDVTSQVNLALFHLSEGVSRNPVKGALLLRLAADQGCPQGQCYLAICYLNGDGVPQDCARAVRLLALSASQGYARAQLELGKCLYRGSGVGMDKKRAFALIEDAAKHGLEEARRHLEIFRE